MKRTSFPRALILGIPILFPHPLRADNTSLSLASVLARYQQATASVSGQAAVKSRRTAGTTDYGELHGTFVQIEKFPGKTWREDKIGLFDDTSGSDGSIAWQRDANGNVRLQSVEEHKDDRTDAAVNTGAFADQNVFHGTVILRSRTERKTGDYILDVTPTDGKLTTLYLDPKTFFIVKEERQEDSRLSVTTYSDFRMLGGRIRATMERSHSGDRKYDTVVKFATIDDDVDAPDNLFALPATANNYTWATPGATSATVPFDYSDKSIALYCAINGRPAFLELDSGASGIAIAKNAIDTLKLPYVGTTEARGYGGSIDEHPVKLDSFQVVDGVVFSNLTATALSFFDGAALYQIVPVAGLLGYDLLSHFVVRVDYLNQEVTLIDPKTFTPTAADGEPLALDLDDNTPSVLASFDGLPPARFLVDTGDSASAVQLYRPYVAANHLDKKYPHGVEMDSQGIGGESKQRRVRGHAFTIGGLTLADVPIDLSEDTKGAGASQTLAGALGSDFLSHFTLTFDYAHSRVYFAANAGSYKPFDTRSFGVYVYRFNDEFNGHKTEMRMFVDPESPAASNRVPSGGLLLKIDGQDVDTLGLGEVHRLLSATGGKDSHDLSFLTPAGFADHAKVTMYDPLPPASPK